MSLSTKESMMRYWTAAMLGLALAAAPAAARTKAPPVIEGQTAGFIKLQVHEETGEILGATIVAPQASGLIAELSLMMTAKLGLSALSLSVAPCATHSEAIQKIAKTWERRRQPARSRRLVDCLARLV